MSPEQDRRFAAFFTKHSPGLGRLAVMLARDPEVAADCVQTTWERAYARWLRIERTSHPLAYLRRMLINAVTDEQRSLGRSHRLEVRVHDISRGAAPAAVETQVADRSELRLRLASLPPRQRSVVVLRYYLDFSESQTARLLRISVGAVKTHASRGLTHLRYPEPD